MVKVLVNLSESAYKEMCENGIDNVDYDIRRMIKGGIVISRNLCDSCINNGCIFHSGIVRNHCDFYIRQEEPERKKGKWIDLRCDQCGQVDCSKPNFCPNCGADMREGEEE